MKLKTEQKEDSRLRSVEELLCALHAKFSANFDIAKPTLSTAAEAERQVRSLSVACKILERLAGDVQHQRALAACLDEIFADSMCAIYLAFCGLNIPARMLLRRSLELGLVVTAYWDSAVDYWSWREHDTDVRFQDLCTFLQSNGYKSLLVHQRTVSKVDASETLRALPGLYSELSNVVHPKTYNFSTAGSHAFNFCADDLAKTLTYVTKVSSALGTVLAARFAELSGIVMSSQNAR
jgi:hypothetical protein